MLSTLADELRHPSFPADQLERLRAQTLSGLEDARQDTGGTGGAGTQAEIAFAQAIYPKGHPVLAADALTRARRPPKPSRGPTC